MDGLVHSLSFAHFSPRHHSHRHHHHVPTGSSTSAAGTAASSSRSEHSTTTQPSAEVAVALPEQEDQQEQQAPEQQGGGVKPKQGRGVVTFSSTSPSTSREAFTGSKRHTVPFDVQALTLHRVIMRRSRHASLVLINLPGPASVEAANPNEKEEDTDVQYVHFMETLVSGGGEELTGAGAEAEANDIGSRRRPHAEGNMLKRALLCHGTGYERFDAL